MAGRDDYGILRASLVTDLRTRRAAAAMVEKGLAVSATSVQTVCGVCTLLGLWFSRETDDGTVLGDCVLEMALATASVGCPPDVHRTVIDILVDAGLLARGDDPQPHVRLVDFEDWYGPLAAARMRDRERKRAKRSKPKRASQGRPKDVRGTSEGRPRDVRGNGSERSGAERSDPERSGSQSVPDCAPPARVPVAAPAKEGEGTRPRGDRIPGPDPSRRVVGTLTIARRQELIDAGYDPERLPPIERCMP